MIKRLFRVLGLLMFLLAGANAKAAPTYQFIWAGGGDVNGLTAINNLGQVLMTSGQLCGGSPCSHIRDMRETHQWQTFTGLPIPGFPEGTDKGTLIQKFNSTGDMVGVSGYDGGGGTPTFWRDGVAYDMTDPANAHLVFVPDVGVGFGDLFLADLNLNIVNPDEIGVFGPDLDWFFARRRHAWHNVLGDYAFEVGEMRGETAYLLRLSVPLPSTTPLVGVALLALVLSSRRQRSR